MRSLVVGWPQAGPGYIGLPREALRSRIVPEVSGAKLVLVEKEEGERRGIVICRAVNNAEVAVLAAFHKQLLLRPIASSMYNDLVVETHHLHEQH
jgi:hypothetical protein